MLFEIAFRGCLSIIRHMAQIHATLPDGTTQIFELPSIEGDIAMLGRADTCQYVVSSEAVSQEHCAFTKAGKNYYMTDRNSANGIVVNGEQLGRVLLRPEVPYLLGDVYLYFVPDVASASAENAPRAVVRPRAKLMAAQSLENSPLAGLSAQTVVAAPKQMSFGAKLALLAAVAVAFYGGLTLRHHQATGNWNLFVTQNAQRTSHK